MVLKSGTRTIKSIKGIRVSMTSDATLILPGDSPKIGTGQVHFTKDALDAIVVFEKVLPSVVQEKYLSAIFVDDQPAEHNKNVRLVATTTGTIIFPHGPNYAALKTFKSTGLKGKPREFVVLQVLQIKRTR